jgi:hypothetical protein
MVGSFANEAKSFLVTRLLEVTRLSTTKADGVYIGHLVRNHLNFTTPTRFLLLHLLCHSTFCLSYTVIHLSLRILWNLFITWGNPLVRLKPILLWIKLRIRTLKSPRRRHTTRSKTIRLWRELRVWTLVLLKGLLLLLSALLKLVVVELPIPVVPSPPSRSSSSVPSSTPSVSHDHLFRLQIYNLYLLNSKIT